MFISVLQHTKYCYFALIIVVGDTYLGRTSLRSTPPASLGMLTARPVLGMIIERSTGARPV